MSHIQRAGGRRRAAAAVFAGVCSAAACGEAPPPAEPSVRPVRTQVAHAAAGGRVRTFSGVARASIESSLGFRIGGVVARVPVAVGDRVRAGQMIAELDPVDYELGVQEAEAGLRQAEAQAENAEAGLQRTRNLYENANASRTDLDAAVASAASAAAQVEAAAKRLERAERQAGYTQLSAPASGAIAAVLADAGETVSPGQPIVEFAAGAVPEVTFAAPEALIREIREGASASVRFGAIPGVRFAGVVTEVGVASGGAATTFPVTVRLGPDAADVRPGMAAEVAIEFGEPGATGRFVLPVQAVAEDRAGRFVFVAAPAGDGFAEVQRRPVTVGELADDGIEILAGLVEGDRVIVAGVSRLQDGERVRFEAGQNDER